jgi:all-trans-8'-apo-beta-carotenal 15,15'-oxygenase
MSNQPSRIIAIPRHTSEDSVQKGLRIWETQAGFVFHHVNAFEVGNEIVLHSICYESLSDVEPEQDYRQTDFAAGSPGQIWQFNISLQDNQVQRQLIEPRACEFPTIHPDKIGRAYRYLYTGAADSATGNAPLQAILKVDLVSGTRELWSAAPHGFVGEPIFVPRKASEQEDDGWILVLVYDGANHRSDLVILDARNYQKAEIARLHLQHHIPYGLHGTFVPELFVN